MPTQVKKSAPVDRFNHISDDKLQLAIPIGPRFQADVPDWTGPPHKNYPHGALTTSDSSKWLGTVIWSMDTTPQSEGDGIGKGRPDSCSCATPGSILCVKRHVANKTALLLKNLGPAFQKWKFHEMGEAVAKLWKQPEQQKLTNLMKKIPFSEGEDFVKPALDYFPSKSRKDIFSFYFNVYIPRRMSIQSRSGSMMVDTDDEEEKSKIHSSKGSRKRDRVDGVPVYSPKVVKTRYLTGRR
ncbi:hypothetical protein CTI12_AA233830 [Artemisia annua]|uniref:ELM2 domain-containing protein n=1 Tax=Artemisia annua TaxID=35608 RepID=A0A2U1NSW3_ARTAN|nr:hypothetical protein CTI12_AA233830 [Artemisia annua]